MNYTTYLKSEEIELEINKTIEKNPGVTKNKVAEEISEKGISSKVTTLKKIDELISRGIIDDRKEGNSFHRLYLNDQGEFNRIDKELSEIEMTVLRMRDNLVKFQELNHENKRPNRKFNDLHSFLHEHIELVDLFLHNLLLQINNNVKFEKDKQLLYSKIIRLMVVNDRYHVFKDVRMTGEFLTFMQQRMTSVPFRNYAKEVGMKLSAMENFMSVAENFRIKYLTDQNILKQAQTLIAGNKNNY